MGSKIEWTQETWNPAVGCEPVSPGCDHCYASGVASRQMQPAHVGLTVGRRWNGEVRTLPDRILEPLHWPHPRRVFVGSMTDMFHPRVSADFLAAVWGVMAAADHHTFQVLTKRPARAARLLAMDGFADRVRRACPDTSIDVVWPLPNVWLGTSIESNDWVWRADRLREAPAAVRFLSCEPLLGPLYELDLSDIDWVICGGESGPGARPMHPDWVRDLRDLTSRREVPFFFKQWGAWLPYEQDPQPPFLSAPTGDTIDGHHLPVEAQLNPGDIHRGWLIDDDVAFRRVGKAAAGRVLDGRTWDEFPPEARHG